MKKNFLLKILLILVLVAGFNLVVFLTTHDFTNTFWVSYGYVMFSYVLLGVSLLYVRPDQKLFTGVSFVALTLIYHVLALALGIICMIFKDMIPVFPFISQSLLVILYIGIAIIGLMGTNITTEKLVRDDNYLRYLNTLAYRISVFEQKVTDEAAKKQLNALFEAVKSSPYHSNAGAHEIEARLTDKIDELQHAVNEYDYPMVGKLVAEASQILNERNNYLKMNH